MPKIKSSTPFLLLGKHIRIFASKYASKFFYQSALAHSRFCSMFESHFEMSGNFDGYRSLNSWRNINTAKESWLDMHFAGENQFVARLLRLFECPGQILGVRRIDLWKPLCYL